jgi:tRNA-specific 2-thiouridylase
MRCVGLFVFGKENIMIVCGMSGGVDSSVAAYLLAQRGEQVNGVFMRNWDEGDPECRAEQDRMDALRVCASLNIPFRVMDFSSVYRQQVFQSFLDGYARGTTPNPDILCNREVKFGVFLDAVLSTGAERLATGHYARKATRQGRAVLLRAVDPSKDQSYFLSAIDGQALARAEFPLGELPKSQVRQIAREAGLLTAGKKDSTGICFIGERDFKDFLARYLPAQPGPIVDLDGRQVGTHQGALYYTVGQRAPVGGIKGGQAGPWFIARKLVAQNTLVIVPGTHHPDLMSSQALTDTAHWIAGAPPAAVFDCQVQLRHLGQAHAARVRVGDDGRAHIEFQEPVRAVAPGQQAVFYQDDLCLGGGELQAPSLA